MHMSVSDSTSDFFVRFGIAANNFLLEIAGVATTLKKDAERYDPRYAGTVGLAIGAATLHERPWDAALGSMVLKLAASVQSYHNSHIYSDEVQQALLTRVFQTQSRIWE